MKNLQNIIKDQEIKKKYLIEERDQLLNIEQTKYA
jgi:hypothetical protein